MRYIVALLVIILLTGCTECMDGWSASHYIPKDTVINTQKDTVTIRDSEDNEKEVPLLERIGINIPKETITAGELKEMTGGYIDSHTLPTDIYENSVAYSSEDCNGRRKYSIRRESDLEEASKWEFDNFIKEYNKDCNDCLIVISNGCC